MEFMDNKERKIILSATKLQKSIFDFKLFVKDLPKEITREQADKLAIEAAKNISETYTHLGELIRLVKQLKPGAFDNNDDEHFREMDRQIGGLKAMIKFIEGQAE